MDVGKPVQVAKECNSVVQQYLERDLCIPHLTLRELHRPLVRASSAVQNRIAQVSMRNNNRGKANRTAEGVTSELLDQGKHNFYTQDYKPQGSLADELRRIGLQQASEYTVCPVCSGVTSDALPDHLEKHHPLLMHEIPLESTIRCPTMDDIVSYAAVRSSCAVLPHTVLPLGDLREAITIYTMETEIYRAVNAAMRTNCSEGVARWRPYIYVLSTALNKLPVYTNPVYRAVDFHIPCNLYEHNSLVTWQSFSSCTSNPVVVKDFLMTAGVTNSVRGTLFIIASVSGTCVSTLSALPEEEEVLLPPNSQFRVSGHVSLGTRKLLELAVSTDLSDVIGCELTEVKLREWSDVLHAMTADEVVRNPKVVKLLQGSGLRCVGDPTGCPRSRLKNTPLHHAVTVENNRGLIQLLVSCGNPVSEKNARHQRPEDMEGAHSDTVAWMLYYAGKGPPPRRRDAISGTSGDPITGASQWLVLRMVDPHTIQDTVQASEAHTRIDALRTTLGTPLHDVELTVREEVAHGSVFLKVHADRTHLLNFAEHARVPLVTHLGAVEAFTWRRQHQLGFKLSCGDTQRLLVSMLDTPRRHGGYGVDLNDTDTFEAVHPAHDRGLTVVVDTVRPFTCESSRRMGDYFGEQIGLWTCWVTNYMRALVVLVVLSLVGYAVQTAYPAMRGVCSAVLSVGCAVWYLWWAFTWQYLQQQRSIDSGMVDDAVEVDAYNPHFKGDWVPIDMHSPDKFSIPILAHRDEDGEYRQKVDKQNRRCVVWATHCTLYIVLLLYIALQYMITLWRLSGVNPVLSSIVVLLVMNIVQVPGGRLTRWLTDKENLRTKDTYEKSRACKILLLMSVTEYTPLMLLLLHGGDAGQRATQFQHQIIVNYICCVLCTGYIQHCWWNNVKQCTHKHDKTHHDEHSDQLLTQQKSVMSALCISRPFPPLLDVCTGIVQHSIGYVVLFTGWYPLVPLYALIATANIYWCVTWSLLHKHYQRPFARCIRELTYVQPAGNAACVMGIVVYMFVAHMEWPYTPLYIDALRSEHIIVCIILSIILLHWAIPCVPQDELRRLAVKRMLQQDERDAAVEEE